MAVEQGHALPIVGTLFQRARVGARGIGVGVVRPTSQLRLRWGAGAELVVLAARWSGGSADGQRSTDLAVASSRYQMIAGVCRCRLLARPGSRWLSAR